MESIDDVYLEQKLGWIQVVEKNLIYALLQIIVQGRHT